MSTLKGNTLTSSVERSDPMKFKHYLFLTQVQLERNILLFQFEHFDLGKECRFR